MLRVVPPTGLATAGVTADPALLALADRAAAGDPVATRELVRRVAPRVTQAVRIVMGAGHPDLDDVVQQALISLIQALPAFRGECPPDAYASRIAVRAAVAARRRATTQRARHDEGVDADSLVDEGGGPTEAAAATRRRALVRALLDELPIEQGETVALRFGLGWSLEEVARVTGAPVNTVRSRLRLAKNALRRRIEENPELGEELEVDS